MPQQVGMETHWPSTCGFTKTPWPYALMSWRDLGAVYPPALEALQQLCDRTEATLREGNGTFDEFHDFSSINETLVQTDRTVELFAWLDSHQPELAQRVYPVAQSSLTRAGEYRLCGRYLNTDKAFAIMIRVYRTNLQMARKPGLGDDLREFAEASFTHQTTTLVSLLVRNDLPDEADRINALALEEWNDPKFSKELAKARTGEVPAPWPPMSP